MSASDRNGGITSAAKSTVEPRTRVRSMPEYRPPLGNRDQLRLDFNENTVGCSPRVLSAIQRLTAADLTRYPERGPVEALAAEHLGVATEQIILTNGVDEAIHVLCEAFLDAGDELLLPVPTYTMYGIYAASTDAVVRQIEAGENFAFPFEALLAGINRRTKLIAVANPNSPAGSIATRAQILAIAEAAPHALVLVDEAYFHFYGETILDLVGTVPNLIVARTFSKAYGLAGLRLGLLSGAEGQLRWVRRVLSPYSVNTMALVALRAALADTAYVAEYVAEVKLARTEFLAGLDGLKVRYWPTQANFVLVKIGDAHGAFVEAMRNEAILVRDRSGDPGCDGCVRITIGTRTQMRRAVEAAAAFVKAHGGGTGASADPAGENGS